MSIISPIAVLAARRKLTCPICTKDTGQPVMLDEGAEWEAHRRTRAHRRRAVKQERDRLGITHEVRKSSDQPVVDDGLDGRSSESK